MEHGDDSSFAEEWSTVSPDAWSRDLRHQTAQVRSEMLGRNAVWVDEFVTGAVGRTAATINNHRMWHLLMVIVISVDIAAAIAFRSSLVLSSIAEHIVEGVIMALMVVDLAIRVLVEGWTLCRELFGIVDVILLVAIPVLGLCDLVVFDMHIPFTVLRLLRPILRCRHMLDHVIDTAVDRQLAKALGDIMYIMPNNSTARPSEGLFVLEKTHLRPQAFADIHSPVTIKGGFVELLYIDLQLDLSSSAGLKTPRRSSAELDNPHSKRNLKKQSSKDSEGTFSSLSNASSMQDLESNDEPKEEPPPAEGSKASQVTIVLKNVLLVLGPGKCRHDEQGRLIDMTQWGIDELCANKDRLVQIVARRTEMLVGKSKQPKPQAGKGERWQPPPTTVLGKLRHFLQSGPLKRLDLHHVSVDVQNVKVLFEDTLLPKPLSAGFHVGTISLRIGCGHATTLRSEQFRACPIWDHERDPKVKHGGLFTASEGDGKHPPVRISCSCQPLMAWCDRSTGGRDAAFKRQTFTHFFEAEMPKISELVRAFKRNINTLKFEFPGLAAMNNSGDGEEGRDSKHSKPGVLDKMLPHHYVLLPVALSFHSMSLDPSARVSTEQGLVESHPEQVSDLAVSRVAFQIDQGQVEDLLALVRYMADWVAMDARIMRKPHARLCDTPARHKHSVAWCWWAYAAEEIATEIAPKGKLAKFLEHRRVGHLQEVYTQLVMEQMQPNLHRSASSLGLGDNSGDRVLKRLQVALPLSTIIRARNAAKRRLQLRDQATYKATLSARSDTTTSVSSSRVLKRSKHRRIWKEDHSRSKHGEPSQAHLRVSRVGMVLLGKPNEVGVRAELVHLRLQGLAAIWTRGAPEDHFHILQTTPPGVLDHPDPGKHEYVDGPADSSILSIAQLSHLGPASDAVQEHAHAWNTLEVSVDLFTVVYCQAPSEMPKLRKVLSRDLLTLGGELSSSASPVRGAGSPMLRMRAIWQSVVEPTGLEGGDDFTEMRGVVVVYCCSLRVLLYQPLVDTLLATIKLPPGRIREDRLQLRDLGRRLKARRRQRAWDRLQKVGFELATGAKDIAGKERQFGLDLQVGMAKRCFLVMAGARATWVRQFSKYYYLVQQGQLPRGQYAILRQNWAPVFSAGLSWLPNDGNPTQPEDTVIEAPRSSSRVFLGEGLLKARAPARPAQAPPKPLAPICVPPPPREPERSWWLSWACSSEAVSVRQSVEEPEEEDRSVEAYKALSELEGGREISSVPARPGGVDFDGWPLEMRLKVVKLADVAEEFA